MITFSEVKGWARGWKLVILAINFILIVRTLSPYYMMHPVYVVFLQIEAFVLIGISSFGKHSIFVGELPLLAGLQFCGGALLIPILLGLVGLARKDREFDTTKTYFIVLLVVYGIVFVVQIAITAACFTYSDDENEKMITKVGGY